MELIADSANNCLVIRLKNVRPHPNADRVKLAEALGEIENGQTLCAEHNFRKKNYKQTETGKKMFIRLYELAKSQDDEDLMKFCAEILEVFEKNGINGHIEWVR